MLPDPPLYFPFAKTHWQLKLGLMPLKLADWIAIDSDYPAYLARKAELLQHQFSDVFADLPGSEPAQQEILELLLDHLLHTFPQYFDHHNHHITNHLTQQTWHKDDFADHPLDLAGRLIQEDLCLMQPTPMGYSLIAGSVCFPSHWSLTEKLGQPLTQIHHPVPGYKSVLAQPVDHYFDRLTGDHPGYRFNWSVVDTPELCLVPHVIKPSSQALRAPTAMTADTIGQHLWMRVERQTLQRLSPSQSILFTIRTYRYPLSTLEHYPTMARNLLAAVTTMPAAMQQYKNILPIQPALCDYLDRISGSYEQP